MDGCSTAHVTILLRNTCKKKKALCVCWFGHFWPALMSAGRIQKREQGLKLWALKFRHSAAWRAQWGTRAQLKCSLLPSSSRPTICAFYASCSLYCSERKQHVFTHPGNNVISFFFFLLFVTLRWLLKPARRIHGDRHSTMRFILCIIVTQYVHPFVHDAINHSQRWSGPVRRGIPPL